MAPIKSFDTTKTAGYREAMNDLKTGRVYHADNAEDMFKQILGYDVRTKQKSISPISSYKHTF